jgi:hypothetical protein
MISNKAISFFVHLDYFFDVGSIKQLSLANIHTRERYIFLFLCDISLQAICRFIWVWIWPNEKNLTSFSSSLIVWFRVERDEIFSKIKDRDSRQIFYEENQTSNIRNSSNLWVHLVSSGIDCENREKSPSRYQVSRPSQDRSEGRESRSRSRPGFAQP